MSTKLRSMSNDHLLTRCLNLEDPGKSNRLNFHQLVPPLQSLPPFWATVLRSKIKTGVMGRIPL